MLYLIGLLLLTYGLSVAVDKMPTETREEKFNANVVVISTLLGVILIILGVL